MSYPRPLCSNRLTSLDGSPVQVAKLNAVITPGSAAASRKGNHLHFDFSRNPIGYQLPTAPLDGSRLSSIFHRPTDEAQQGTESLASSEASATCKETPTPTPGTIVASLDKSILQVMKRGPPPTDFRIPPTSFSH